MSAGADPPPVGVGGVTGSSVTGEGVGGTAGVGSMTGGAVSPSVATGGGVVSSVLVVPVVGEGVVSSVLMGRHCSSSGGEAVSKNSPQTYGSEWGMVKPSLLVVHATPLNVSGGFASRTLSGPNLTSKRTART